MKKIVILLLLCLFKHASLLGYVEEYEEEVTEENEYAVSFKCEKSYCDVNPKESRYNRNEGRNRIIDAMLSTPFLNLNQNDPDIFSFTREKYDLPKGIKGPLAEYDFIVVGAGSAGCVLASRLSEDRKYSVLLLEAGRGESLFTDVPILAPYFQQTPFVWPYMMELQPDVCKGMEGGRCFWPRGKAVGGSSVINYMIYTRGLQADWDGIASDGNNGWSYQDVLQYYMKSEQSRLKGLTDSPYHGSSGELVVSDVPFRSKLSKAFLDAAESLGHRKVDYNSPDGIGFSYIQATMSQGHRQSSAKAFLHNNKKRKNLHILPNSRVTKVVIDENTKTASGVEFYRNGRMYRIRAKKEVILSAGPIESPHLLLLSGIGPRQHLRSLNIPVIHDLKVGESLYDHITFPALTFILNTTRLTLIEKKIATVENVVQFAQYGDGPLSSLAGVEAIGYIKSNSSDELSYYSDTSDEFNESPDIEILGSCASLASDEGTTVAKGLHLADWLYKDNLKPVEKYETFTLLPVLLHPKSKGRLKLRSANPFEDPLLYGNYLKDPRDTATMITAIKYIIKLVETPAFQKYGARLHAKKFPNCKKHFFGSDRYWECALRTVTATLHHQIATCKMGPASDPEAVVDPELRVHGVNNLRVVDSSVIPRTIAAHTNAPAIMIGEKAADMIKDSWEY